MRTLLALLLAATLLLPAPSILAQGSTDADLIREAYGFIREYALRLPEPQAIFARALAGVRSQNAERFPVPPANQVIYLSSNGHLYLALPLHIYIA